MTEALIPYIENVAREQQLSPVIEQLKELQKFSNEINVLDVVILGQFKAGKSTFLNQLIGYNVLPVGVLPVTAVITRLNYGAEKKAVVTFLDDSKTEITLLDLPEYVTEKGNSENIKNVYIVDIFLPELISLKNIRLIDTPGLGSAFEHNTRVTKEWYNKIVVAIVVISATQPLSENDLEVIRSASEQSPEVSVILTKVDLISSDEQQEILNFIKNKTKDILHGNFKIFPFSSIKNTSLYKQTIADTLFKALLKNKNNVKNQIYNHKLKYILSLTIGYLKIKLQVAGKSEQEKITLKNKIFDEQLQRSFINKELDFIATNYQNNIRGKLEYIILEQKQKAILDKLTAGLKIDFKQWHGNLNVVARNYEQWLKKEMHTTLLQLEKDIRPDEQHILDEAATHFNQYIERFRDRINQRIQKVLNITLPEEVYTIKIEPLVRPDINTSWAFESHIDMLWFLIPMPLMRNMFLKNFLKQLPSETEKNLRRLIAWLNKNMIQAVEKAHSESLNYIFYQLDNIEKLVLQENTDINSLTEAVSKLENYQKSH